jgi:hypothetical protein
VGLRSRWERRSAEAITVPEVRDLTIRGDWVSRRWYHRKGASEARANRPSRRRAGVDAAGEEDHSAARALI